jgi:hypothetical protein
LVAYAIGSIVRVSFANGVVNYIFDTLTPDVTTTKIGAIDAKRIKINDTIYRFKTNVDIYYKDILGNITIKGTNDIDLTKTFSSVKIYLDKPLSSNGKAILIFISE